MRVYKDPRKQKEREQRILNEAQWYIENKTSVREVAKHFDVSKTTVWLDFTERLEELDTTLYGKVSEILNFNLEHMAEKVNEVNRLTGRWDKKK